MKDNTLITITRQYGSGGREVSAIVAKNWDCAATTAKSWKWLPIKCTNTLICP